MTVTLANSTAAYDWRDRPTTDFYPTPHNVTQALLDFLYISPGTSMWEPACGEGHMVDVLRANGYQVRGTDIQSGDDFLQARSCAEEFIITNPPFGRAEEFIRHCYELRPAKGFALLLKSQYWHSAKRLKLWQATSPQYVLPLTWRPDFLFGAKSGSPTMEVLWTVWTYGEECRYCPLAKPKELK